MHVEVVADELSVPTVGMLTRRPLLFKQPAVFSLATGTAAAFPTATVEQEYGGKRRSQEVRAAAQRPLSNTLASRSESTPGSKHSTRASDSTCAFKVVCALFAPKILGQDLLCLHVFSVVSKHIPVCRSCAHMCSLLFPAGAVGHMTCVRTEPAISSARKLPAGEVGWGWGVSEGTEDAGGVAVLLLRKLELEGAAVLEGSEGEQ